MIISLDMYQTLFAAVCVLMLGRFLKARIGFLEKFCIPAPVIGGVLFAVFTCLCYVTGIAEFEFDDILKEVCMVFFFTSVGFQANLKVLKSGGKSLIIFLGLVIALILCQNFLAVGLADLLGISPMIGLCTGSIPMVGGHGTAGAFGPVLEDFGVAGATTLCTAAATYGLIAGSVMGGPTGRLLIERRKLLDTVVPEDDSLLVEEEIKHERHTSMYPAAVFQLIIAIGIGTFISKALAMTGLTFPIYIGAMIAAACMRNIGEFTHKFTEEVRKQTAYQRDQQIRLDRRGILFAQGLHVGHGVGRRAHAKAADARCNDRSVIVAAHDVENHKVGEQENQQRLARQQDDERQCQRGQLPQLQRDHGNAQEQRARGAEKTALPCPQ